MTWLRSCLAIVFRKGQSEQEFLRQRHITTTLQLYVQSDIEAKTGRQVLGSATRRQNSSIDGANPVIILGANLAKEEVGEII